jgi:hypothetical protein
MRTAAVIKTFAAYRETFTGNFSLLEIPCEEFPVRYFL